MIAVAMPAQAMREAVGLGEMLEEFLPVILLQQALGGRSRPKWSGMQLCGSMGLKSGRQADRRASHEGNWGEIRGIVAGRARVTAHRFQS